MSQASTPDAIKFAYWVPNVSGGLVVSTIEQRTDWSLDYNVKLKGAYPVVIFSYGLGRTDGSGPNGLGVRQFESYLVAGCGEVAKSLGYVPVSGAVLQKAIALAATIK